MSGDRDPWEHYDNGGDPLPGCLMLVLYTVIFWGAVIGGIMLLIT